MLSPLRDYFYSGQGVRSLTFNHKKTKIPSREFLKYCRTRWSDELKSQKNPICMHVNVSQSDVHFSHHPAPPGFSIYSRRMTYANKKMDHYIIPLNMWFTSQHISRCGTKIRLTFIVILTRTKHNAAKHSRQTKEVGP